MPICLHDPYKTDWSNNGICTLRPTKCEVTEKAGGMYDIVLEHPITPDGRALSIGRGFIIKAPVPARETPLIQQRAAARPGQAAHVVYEVYGVSSYAKVYSKASTGYSSYSSTRSYTKGSKVKYSGRSYRWNSDVASIAGTAPPGGSWVKISTGSKSIAKLKNGAELLFLDEDDGWVHCTTSAGLTGYIQSSNVRHLRDEPYKSDQPAYNTAVKPRQVREQYFRVYDYKPDDNTQTVTCLARHISYDQLKNTIKSYNPGKAALQSALISMSGDCINEHDFVYYTNIIAEISAEWARLNAVEAICDADEGVLAKVDARLIRDNYDTFLLTNPVTDRGVYIRYGKNLSGLTFETSDDNVVSRIMPYGTDKSGKVLYLPEVYVDSPHIGEYPVVHSVPLQVSEAVEKEAKDGDPGMTKAQCYAKMRAAAQAKFDAGCDLPDLTATVDFVHLGDTVEYAQYKGLQQVFLYDTVTVVHGPFGMNYKTQVTGYTFDSILKRYTSITLGTIRDGADLGFITGAQLPSDGISGTKLKPGSVGSQHLRELSVLSAHIGLAQIVNAHIQDATIDTAKIRDFVAEVAAIAVAKIGEAFIDVAWIAQLTAEVVDIVTANIDTLIANNVNINWANIANLTAAVTDIVLAKIQTANIGWAQIVGLSAETALFTQGASGKLYCADFMATDANIESLSANKIAGGMATFGKLMLMGEDGKLYEINIGSLGEVTASEKLLEGDNVGDYTLLDRNLANGTLTARTLNVQDIFANSALVRQLIAQHIDVDTLFANEAYTNKLRTNLIESDIGGLLKIVGDGGVSITVEEAVAAAQGAADGAYQRVAGVDITEDGVAVYGKQFTVQDVAGADPTFSVNTIENFIKAQNADLKALLLNGNLSGSNNIMLKTTTTTVNVAAGGSIQAAINALPKYLVNNITINVPAGTYSGDVKLQGFVGTGSITVAFASGVTILGSLIVTRCMWASFVGDSASYANIIGGTVNTNVVYSYRSFLYARYLRVTGRVRTNASDGNAYGFYISEGSSANIRDCTVERTLTAAIQFATASIGQVDNCNGGAVGDYTTVANLGYGIRVYEGSHVGIINNGPTGTTAATNTSRATIVGTNTPTVSPGAPSAPTIISVSYVYNSVKYCDLPIGSNMNTASSVWSSGAPRGGAWPSQDEVYSGMWLLKLSTGAVQNILTGLSGKTIQTANLTIHCDTCWAGSTTQDLFYMKINSLPSGGDAPSSRLTDTGINVTLTQGEDTVVNLKTWLQSMVTAGTAFYGFGLGVSGSYAKMDLSCDLDITYS